MKFPITYTFLRDYENCPHKAWHKYILRDQPFEKTEAMADGDAIHKRLERRLLEGRSLSGDPRNETILHKANHYITILDKLADGDHPVRVEYMVGVKKDGSPCAWDATDCWMRGKADVAVLLPAGAWIIDWKYQNKREDPFELECQAFLLQAHHPQISSWAGEYFWFKDDPPYGLRHTLDPMRTYRHIGVTYGEMMQDHERGVWPKRPNPLCSWCGVKSCEHRKERK